MRALRVLYLIRLQLNANVRPRQVIPLHPKLVWTPSPSVGMADPERRDSKFGTAVFTIGSASPTSRFHMAECKRCGRKAQFMSDLCADCINNPVDHVSPVAVSATPTDFVSARVQSNSRMVNRYQDAYRVGTALVALGNAIKAIGALLAVVILGGSFTLSSGSLGSSAVMIGVVMAAISGGVLWVGGVLVSAQGQILRATLDNAVSNSPFMTERERLDAMGLPQIAVGSSG